MLVVYRKSSYPLFLLFTKCSHMNVTRHSTFFFIHFFKGMSCFPSVSSFQNKGCLITITRGNLNSLPLQLQIQESVFSPLYGAGWQGH